MKNPIGVIPTADPRFARPAPQPAAADAAARKAADAVIDSLANARLVIEENGEGSYVYKSLDRITGEVLRQFPREDVVKMFSSADYSAGDVIKTRA